MRSYRNARPVEVRWTVFKDYYSNGTNFTDTHCVLFGTEAEAEEMKAKLEGGCDKSWYDSSDLDASAFLYVDKITL